MRNKYILCGFVFGGALVLMNLIKTVWYIRNNSQKPVFAHKVRSNSTDGNIAGRLGGPMNVLISGGPSPLGVHLADYLLRKGHRVSIMQHQELDVSALVEDIARTVDLQDRLKTSNYGNRLSELHGTTCSLKTTTTQSVDITNVSHVVFDGTHLCGITRAIVVRRSLGCLVELLEATKGGNTRPHFTLLVNAGVTGKADFTSVLESSMEIVVSLYQSLYGVPVTLVKLLYSTDNRIWTASGEASVVVGELPPAIIETMLTGPTCKHIYIAKSSSSGLHLSWSQLWNTWNDPSAGTLSPPTNSKWEDVVFTTFLTSKKDPQRNIFVKKDNYSYMADWHLSLHNVGIKAVVFHDGLGDQFRKSLQPDIAFQKMTLGVRSTNDERYFQYLSYIERHPNIKRILFTDISDVVFLRNPFDLMRHLGDRLYIGDDMEGYPLIGNLPWTVRKITSCFGNNFNNEGETKSLNRFSIVYNAGIIGGPRHIMLRFLRLLTAMLSDFACDKNCNTAVVNLIAHKYFDNVTFSGFPMTSQYKQYEDCLSDVYLVHK